MLLSEKAAAPANVRVLVRVRPFNDRELKLNATSVLEIDDGRTSPAIDFGTNSDSETAGGGKGTISIVDLNGSTGGYASGYDSGANSAAFTAAPSRSSSRFTYDAVFGPQSKQHEIFQSVASIVDAVCAGFNGTIVAYGQTGSGKTHTIFGDDNNAGLIQNSLKSIFKKISEQSMLSPASPASGGAGAGEYICTTTKASFLEIYNERVYDLLSPSDRFAEDEKGLPVRESEEGVYVEGLVEREVRTTLDAMDVLRCGTANRRVSATNMNRASSRSHALFVLTVKSERSSGDGISKVRVSKFTLVDLAGSERQKATLTDGDRLKEASMINNSLLCLGQVINSLVDCEKGKQKHVPFRNSTLTFLLRDSWGGNSKTCLVATVTPSFASMTETISTLKFAQRAKLIKNTAVLNENTCGSVAALQAQIARLRAELELKNNSVTMGNNGDRPLASPGLPLAPTKSKSVEREQLSSDVTVSALRNQNSKLSKKVKLLKEATSHRENQVISLKRKLQQEKLVRKCKERRITYLSNKGKTSGANTDDEVGTLHEEVTILREQLDAQPLESVEWLLKYKEEKAKVEEFEMDATSVCTANKKAELEASVVTLLTERDSLKKKIEDMSGKRNTEIDSIIKDVNKLEKANTMLQSRLDIKEATIVANEEEMRSNKAQISELQEEIKTALDYLESTQNELADEKMKASELKESVASIKMEANEHWSKAVAAEEDLKILAEEHNKTSASLNAKLVELQNGLDVAMESNKSLMKEMKEASDDLGAKELQLKELSQGRNAHLDSFKLKEETLRAEIKKGEEMAGSLLAEKVKATEQFERIAAQNIALSGEVDTLKFERDTLQRRVESLDQLHDHVASLEEEAEYDAIGREQAEQKQSDLERTIRLQEHLSAQKDFVLDDERALCDDIICNLSREKSVLQDELANVSQKLTKTNASLVKMGNLSNSLTAEIRGAEEASERLRNERALAKEELEEARSQRIGLSEEITALKSNYIVLQRSMNTKVTDLEKALDASNGENKLLSSKLKEASSDLDAKSALLERLGHDRNEALSKLEINKKDFSAKVESFKIQEENWAEARDSFLADKAKVAEALEKAVTEKSILSEKMNALTVERNRACDAEGQLELTTKRHADSLAALNTKVEELQKGLGIALDRNKTLARELEESNDNLESTRVQLESVDNKKNELLEKLEQNQEKSTADLQSFKLHEEALKAEIDKGEAAVETVLAEKAEATRSLGKAMIRNVSLAEQLSELRRRHDSLRQNTTDAESKACELVKGNGLLTRQLKESSESLEATKAHQKDLEKENRELLKKLELSQQNTNADLQSFTLLEESLKAEIEKGAVAVETLLVEKAEAAKALENAMSQSNKLLDEVERLRAQRYGLEESVKSLGKQVVDAENKARAASEEMKMLTKERNESVGALDTQARDLQKALNESMVGNETLRRQLKESAKNLESTQVLLERLECNKTKVSKQLESIQNKSTADLQSFKLREETLKAEIEKGSATVEILLSEKANATGALENAMTQSNNLSEEVLGLTNERDGLVQKVADAESKARAASKEIDALNTQVGELKKGLDKAMAGNESLMKQLKESSGSLELTKGLLKPLEHEKNEVLKQLKLQEANTTDIEFSRSAHMTLQEDLTKAKKTIETLNSENEDLKIRMKNLEESAKHTRNNQQTKAQADLDRTIDTQGESTSALHTAHEDDLAQIDCIIGELTEDKSRVQEELTQFSKKLVDSGTGSIEEIDIGCSDDKGAEVVFLKAKLNALERENAALREQSSSKPQPTSSSHPDTASPWKSSPIKLSDIPSQITSFRADDTFDESMFLPNVDGQVNETLDGGATPSTDENKTPSKTPFKEKRALFSPPSKQFVGKKRTRSASKKQSPVPNARVTRSMRKKTRTPLGKSSVENTPSSVRKVRTNWRTSSMF